VIAIDLGCCHLVKLRVLRLLDGLEGLNDTGTSVLIDHWERNAAAAMVGLHRLQLRIDQVVAVKSAAIFGPWRPRIETSVGIGIFTIGVVSGLFSFRL
jgi:hypothetical protein